MASLSPVTVQINHACSCTEVDFDICIRTWRRTIVREASELAVRPLYIDTNNFQSRMNKLGNDDSHNKDIAVAT